MVKEIDDYKAEAFEEKETDYFMFDLISAYEAIADIGEEYAQLRGTAEAVCASVNELLKQYNEVKMNSVQEVEEDVPLWLQQANHVADMLDRFDKGKRWQ